MTSADAFGPWTPSLSLVERRCRWRSLAALAMVYLGAGHPLMRLCLAAEHDVTLADPAWRSLESLAPLRYRRLLAAYAALSELARVIAPAQEIGGQGVRGGPGPGARQDGIGDRPQLDHRHLVEQGERRTPVATGSEVIEAPPDQRPMKRRRPAASARV